MIHGDKSALDIFGWCQGTFNRPNRVLAYIKTKNPHMSS